MFPYSSLVVYTVVSVATSFFVTTFRVSILILTGLHTYIHPENVVNGDGGNVKAVLRRPGETNETNSEFDNYVHLDGHNQAKNKGKSKERSKPDPSKGLRRKKVREKPEFDETNAQMFRVGLVDSQLQSRQYFAEYDEAVIYASLGLCNLLTYQFLPQCLASDDKQASAVFFRGDLVPILVGSFAVYKLARFLGRISLERYSSKNSEKLLSIFVAVLGFLVSLTIFSGSVPGLVDLRVGVDGIVKSKNNEGNQVSFQFGFVKFLLAIFAGWLSGLLFGPACRAARSFWLGTDQLQWNLSVIGSGKITRILFFLNIAMPVFTSLLWIKPMADIFISESSGKQNFNCMKPGMLSSDNDIRGSQRDVPYPAHQNKMSVCSETKEDLQMSGQCEQMLHQSQKSEGTVSAKNEDLNMHICESGSVHNEGEYTKWYFWRASHSFHQENWAQKIGMPPKSFEQFRVWCLLFSGILQLLLMRTNLQMYLNEAVLIWYQRLHGSKVPNLDFSRAKLFLHNYFVCQVALQFFIPGSLVLLFIGLSRTQSINVGLSLLDSFLISSTFIQEAAIFMAWWVQSIWAVLICSNVALYRLGFLIVS